MVNSVAFSSFKSVRFIKQNIYCENNGDMFEPDLSVQHFTVVTVLPPAGCHHWRLAAESPPVRHLVPDVWVRTCTPTDFASQLSPAPLRTLDYTVATPVVCPGSVGHTPPGCGDRVRAVHPG